MSTADLSMREDSELTHEGGRDLYDAHDQSQWKGGLRTSSEAMPIRPVVRCRWARCRESRSELRAISAEPELRSASRTQPTITAERLEVRQILGFVAGMRIRQVPVDLRFSASLAETAYLRVRGDESKELIAVDRRDERLKANARRFEHANRPARLSTLRTIDPLTI